MLFSIICLTYKRPHLLEEAIQSVLQQTLTDWELIVVNDCPSQVFHYEHPQVKIFNLDTKFETLGQKRNFGTSKATGELILQLDDDDLLLPDYLALLHKAIGNADWLCAQKPVYFHDTTNKVILSPVPQYNTFLYRKRVLEKAQYPNLNYDELTPFYESVTKQIGTTGAYRQLKPHEYGYIFRQDITPERGYKMSSFKTESLVEQDQQLRSIQVDSGDIQLTPKWEKNYTNLVRSTMQIPPPSNPNMQRMTEEMLERAKKDGEAWKNVKPTWENAKKFLSAAKSRGLLSTALDAIGVSSDLGERVSDEIYQLRYTSCFGDKSNFIAPCPRLRDMGKQGFFCGSCGCGNNDLARLDSEVEGGYSKLHYPVLACPLKKAGFTNAEPPLPPMSIIIPVLNDQAELTATLRSIRATSPANVEIIVIDDKSDVPAVVPPSVKLIRLEERRGVGGTRWLGAQHATTDYLLFIDSHMRFEDGWYKNAIDRLTSHPWNVVWCGVCLGLEEGNMDIKNHKGAYNGARLAFYEKERNEVFEGKWIPEQEGDNYDISCMMGACYFFNKKWFMHIKGTSSLKMWGSDEPLVSLKTWLAGGELKLMKNVRIGHKFRSASPYKTGVEYIIYNKLRSMYMLLPTDLYKSLESKIQNDGDKQRALQMMHDDAKEIEMEKEYYRSIFTRDVKWFCEKFGIENEVTS